MWLKEKYNILALSLILLLSCTSEKKYEDYNENDFYEVQGAITKVYNTSSVFDNSSNKLMNYVYCVNDSVILNGSEKEFYQAWRFGQPIVVLVHKKDYNINFFARIGLSGTMNNKQAKMIDDVLEMESKKQKTY
tara:strand:+ start:4489 stop:4890 length:402 start_codon:yes stop_codon:yes gene_type:complete